MLPRRRRGVPEAVEAYSPPTKTRGPTLVAWVGEFKDAWDGRGERPIHLHAPFAPLPFAEHVAADLRSALDLLRDPEPVLLPNPTATALFDQIVDAAQSLGPNSGGDDTVLAFIVSHGYLEPQTERLMVAGADTTHRTADVRRAVDVESLIATMQGDLEGGKILLCLDTCHAGAAVAPRWQSAISAVDRKVYVLGACLPDQEAYRGVFSQAVTKVLREIANDRHRDSSAKEYISFFEFRRRVASALRSMLETAGHPRQELIGTNVQEQDDTRFLRNPQFTDAAPAGSPLSAMVREFAASLGDRAVDPEHFLTRGFGLAGRGGDNQQPQCLFTGRREPLKRIVDWLDDETGDESILLLTGSPGVGKSALLGIVVCAAHSEIHEDGAIADELRLRLPSGLPHRRTPGRIAAVHARQRDLSEIMTSIVAQLALGQRIARIGSLTMRTLCEAVSALTGPIPVIVLDALDESHDIDSVSELLLALVRTQRPDGAPGCRIVLGTRPWWSASAPMTELRTVTEDLGTLIDLDSEDPEVVSQDIREYLRDLLATSDRYQRNELRPVLAALVAGVAKRLAFPVDNGQPALGGFLRARLIAELLEHEGPTSPTAVPAAVAGVPIDLREILDRHLDLESAGRNRVRAILTAVAFAQGDGMPRDLICALAKAFTTEPVDGTVFDDSFGAFAFFLRASVDPQSGTILYRLFHQSLVDYLLEEANSLASPAAVLKRLLDEIELDQDGIRAWAAADPYLIRHAARHAVLAGELDTLLGEAEFLVCADPTRLAAELPPLLQIEDETARRNVIVYRTSQPLYAESTLTRRRDLFLIDGLRHGFVASGSTITGRLKKGVTRWSPSWSTGGTVDSRLLATLSGHRGGVNALVVTRINDQPVVVSGGFVDGELRIWDLVQGLQVGEAFGGSDGRVLALAAMDVEGRPAIVVGGGNHGVPGFIRAWDLEDRRPLGPAVRDGRRHPGAVKEVAVIELDERQIIVSGDEGPLGGDGTIQLWDAASQSPVADPVEIGNGVDAMTVTLIDGRPTAVVASFRKVQSWDLATLTPIGLHDGTESGLFAVEDSGIFAVAASDVEGLPVAVLAGGVLRGTVQTYDPASGIRTGTWPTQDRSAVYSVAIAAVAESPVVFTGSSTNGVIHGWYLNDHSQFGRPFVGHESDVSALAVAEVGRRAVLVSASGGLVGDGTVRIWDLADQGASAPKIDCHRTRVASSFTADVEGRAVAVTADVEGGVLTWDVQDGRLIGAPLAADCSLYALEVVAVGERQVLITAGFRDIGGGGPFGFWDIVTGDALESASGEPSGWFSKHVFALSAICLNRRVLCVMVSGVRQNPDDDDSLELWEFDTGRGMREVSTVPLGGHHGAVHGVSTMLLGDMPVAVTCGEDRTLRLWDLESRTLIGPAVNDHMSPIRAMSTITAGRRPIAVTGDESGELRLWHISEDGLKSEFRARQDEGIRELAVTELDGRLLAATAGFWTLRVWDLGTTRQVYEYSLPHGIGTISWAPDGSLVVGFGNEVACLGRSAWESQW